jgi:hypothetical protein
MEHFGNVVDDRSMIVGGRQHVVTMGDYIIPIDIVNGLPYTPMRPYTDEEWEVLPHIIWTSDSDWDPTVLDSKISNKTDWHLATQMPPSDRPSFPFDRTGNYTDRTDMDPPLPHHPIDRRGTLSRLRARHLNAQDALRWFQRRRCLARRT